MGSDVPAELTTPTGAAILKACAERFGSLPSMTVQAVGYGAGSKDLEGQANVLRVVMGEVDDPPHDMGSSIESDRAIVLETNIDDSTPEQLADCLDRLLAAGGARCVSDAMHDEERAARGDGDNDRPRGPNRIAGADFVRAFHVDWNQTVPS